ncbi:MAG: SDR family NAD(P)-dependent oxidoreductase [Alphaproteobacteria bacterium]
MDTHGRVALVTGSATGIGAASALKFAQRGLDVVINYSKSAKEAEESRAACEAEGVKAIAVQADVSQDSDCRKLAKAALDAFGRIDVLVNNAGGTKFADHADLDALDAEDFQRLYAVNVVGPYQMIRACAPAMKAQGRGAVVNVSSIAGVAGIGSSVAYAATKGALNTMTLSLARALAPEIRINAVCPGFVGTRWFRDRFGEEGFQSLVQHMQNTTPLQTAGTPELVADSVVFMGLEGAEHITGETLLTDAGLHLSMTPLTAR